MVVLVNSGTDLVGGWNLITDILNTVTPGHS
jgi:hypothetical protein